MKTTYKSSVMISFLMMILFSGLLFSCSEEQKTISLDKMKVVATKSEVGNSTVISCNFNKLTDHVNLPLSELVEDIKLVKLDKEDDALVSTSFTTVTDHYILVRNNKQNPYKLFDKKGNFLRTIGSYGQGPYEYLNVYDDYIDEANNRIYILPWQTDKLLVYDLEGNALDPIPLLERVPKGKFYVDAKNETVSIFLLPFANIPKVAWTQDFKGIEINSIPNGHLAIEPDFSNEIESYNNVAAFDNFVFTFYELRPDSLYHYDIAENRLDPVFTLDFKDHEPMIHSYTELPNHFLGNVTVEKKLSDNLSTTEVPSTFIVDKETLKGAFYHLYNDFLGGMPIEWASFSNGYYVRNVEPAVFMEELSKVLKSNNDLSEAERERLSQLLDSCDENDNNYVIYGKLK